MGQRFDALSSTSHDATIGRAPLRLVVAARRRDEPAYEQPRLQLPLPPPREREATIRPREDEQPESPTRGVNVFDMV
jgi:hypothetical protein